MDRNRMLLEQGALIGLFCAVFIAGGTRPGLQAATSPGLNPCNPCAANPKRNELLVGFADEALVMHTEIHVDYCGDRSNCGLAYTDECVDAPLAWNPGGVPDCGSRPVEVDRRPVWGRAFIHFKVLSSDGQCMYFNSRLEGTDTGGDLVMRLPIGAVLSERNITFSGCSDFRRIAVGDYLFDDCVLVPGATYRIEITEQTTICASYQEKERVLAWKLVTVPYAIPWCSVPVKIK